ncbi:hypothetical protein ACFY5D_16700 [Paeniglutamicibacter sp. NPDC012692]|uniref:VG15 protein n=1 Tax=Paeniglutamicibacter sp. NPDC012692 TaxID=3364388 RepID=UPI003677B827
MAFELSYTEVEAQRQTTMKLIESALQELAIIWDAIPDKTDGAIVRMVLEDALGDIIQTYGQVVATHAAQQFDSLRAANKVPGRFTALVAKTPERARVNAHIGAVIEPIFRGAGSNPGLAYKQVQGLVDRMVQEPFRRTIDENVGRSGSRAQGYARVPSSSEPCDFCLMLASRGAVYGPKSGKYRADGKKFHSLCYCQLIPVFDDRTEIEDYSPEALLEQYKDRQAEKAEKVLAKSAKLSEA